MKREENRKSERSYRKADLCEFSLNYLTFPLFSPHDFTQIWAKWGCNGQSTGEMLETVEEGRKKRKRVFRFP